SQGFTVGGSVTLARNALTELFGFSPTRTLSSPAGIAMEIPVAQAYLFSATRGMPDEPVIGQEDELRTWNTGTSTGMGNADDINIGRWGARDGAKIRRLVDVTPWWHYNISLAHVPDKAFPHNTSGTEFYSHERSDVQYTYYRVLPRVDYRLAIRAVDAESQKPVRHATITVTSATGKTETVVTDAKGMAKLRMRLPPDASASSHVSGVAPSHSPSAQDVTMAPKAVTNLTMQFQPLLGTISGTVVDAATGQPVPDVEVILSPATGTAVVHTTGPDGTYQFTDIRPGPFTIRVHKPGYADVNQNIEVIGGQTNTLNFKTAAQQGAVVGRAVDANGAPVAGATVTIVDASGATVSTRTSGADGTFLERLNPGTYTVNVTATGYSPGVATITVPAGENVSVTVTLQKAP
ncbi:MAG: carboxypeptidase regulatory-like domain-containing protein, partial [Chloroflexi bacterium]|nr:carboxypeptidase regulatory-like domain-containing protein [Chloroflexota bacterium]